MKRRNGIISWLFLAVLLPILSFDQVNRSYRIYQMGEYFPLEIGNSWTYGANVVTSFSGEPYYNGDTWLGEPFRDVDGEGVYNPYEVYTDLNQNQQWNTGEPFQDLNQNGVYDIYLDEFVSCDCPSNNDLNHNGEYDGPNEPMPPGIPFIDGVTVLDLNKDGDFEPANGQWDEGEPYSDLNGNGQHDPLVRKRVELTLRVNDKSSVSGTQVYVRHNINPTFDSVIFEQKFSNDQKGLLWWGYRHFAKSTDNLNQVTPLQLAPHYAYPGMRIRNLRTIVIDDTISIPVLWISTCVNVEDVTVPAGQFDDCIRIMSQAEGWPGDMRWLNGTSYQWYAKGAGLVKWAGPAQEDVWELKGAFIKVITGPDST